MPTQVYSFFSGVGFLDLGFENAGFDIVFVNEYNEQFLRSYQYARRNNGHIPYFGYSHEDIRTYLLDEKWQDNFPQYNMNDEVITGFIGGPPCPDFSTAGKNAGETGLNGQLTSAYANLIIRRQPDFFVLENVKGLYRTKKHRAFYDRLKHNLDQAGYWMTDSIENALEYGVPQYRDRLFLIGLKRERFGEHPGFIIGNHKIYNLNEVFETNWPQTNIYNENGELDMPAGIIENLTVEHWFNRNVVWEHPNGRDIFGIRNMNRFTTIPEGDTGGKSFKRLHRWRYSPTAAYGNNEVHLHPYLPRRISIAEALAIQSLPAEFELPQDLSLSAKFKMVGNGVPYLMALGIARDLYEWIENNI